MLLGNSWYSKLFLAFVFWEPAASAILVLWVFCEESIPAHSYLLAEESRDACGVGYTSDALLGDKISEQYEE
ncbi:hypothetical protein GGI42DRAFT_311114 [Trichoderma sp. SZMC 28013]